MDLEAVHWLASPPGRQWLEQVPPYDEAGVISLSARLRTEGLSPEQTAALLTQQRLRARGAEKFGALTDSLLFTADGVEQATRPEVAAAHAQRFANLSLALVHDLGCGIGADALALALSGVRVQAVDADPITAAIAGANLAPWPDAQARCARVEDVDLPSDASRQRVGAWLDPARRVHGAADIHGRTRRLFRLEDISPSWQQVQQIAAVIPATGVKLSPSFPHEQVPPGAEAQWTSRSGDLLECAIWWGPLARFPGRTARIIRPGQPDLVLTPEQADPQVPSLREADELGPWLYEADRALTQAGLVGALTAATGGSELDPGLGIVSADTAYDLAFARRYALSEVLPLAAKPLRAWLRRGGITGLTIKKRGVRLDDAALRRELKIGRGAGSGAAATLLLTRLAGRPVALALTPAAGIHHGSFSASGEK